MARISYATNVVLTLMLIHLVVSGSHRMSESFGDGPDSVQNVTNDSHEVNEIFFRYMQAYEKKDFETLGRIFANDEKLQAFWPDPSNPFRVEGWREVRKGLEGYLRAVSSMTVNIRQPIVQVYGPLAIVSCHWSFAGAVEGKRQVGSGRGSYVFEKRDGTWVIVHLHESAMPRTGK